MVEAVHSWPTSSEGETTAAALAPVLKGVLGRSGVEVSLEQAFSAARYLVKEGHMPPFEPARKTLAAETDVGSGPQWF